MIIKQSIYRHTAMPVLEKGLDAYALRDKSIANNISNVTTPGYQKIKVDFEKELQTALDPNKIKGYRTDNNHKSVGKKALTEISARAYRPVDGTKPGGINNVDIDMEMGQLAENQLSFQYAVELIKNQMESLRSVIRGKPARG